MTVAPLRVSVVINTLDRADRLRDALAGLDGLSGDAIEVVVVKGPCQDQTDNVLEAWKTRIKVASCPDANLARSRNIGLEAAAGDVIAFIDDDAIPHPGWITELLGAYADPAVGAAGGFTIARDGVSFQARTILCDRYGDPHFLADGVDLRPFNRPDSWLFPSLLGTNSSFRRSALEAVGGFDETFTYYLEESDLCLRLVDAGWSVAFVPTALVWHQFAASAQRSENAARRSIEAIIRSHSYFIHRHAAQPWTIDAAKSAIERLSNLRAHWSRGIDGLSKEGVIDERHASFLGRELACGLEQGHALAQSRAAELRGHWSGHGSSDFLNFTAKGRKVASIAFVCRDFAGPGQSGIPQWTGSVARALARRGHRIHIITESALGVASTRFVGGVWVHEIAANTTDYGWVCERYGLPSVQAQWAASVQQYLPVIKGFGLDILSFPIWDLEGIACSEDPDLAVCMSLHTSYGLSTPLRPDLEARPLMRNATAEQMIIAEKRALAAVPHLLANSRSIVRDLERQAGIPLAAKARYAVHGCAAAEAPVAARNPRQVLFAGRFEHRKGFDLAISALVMVAERYPDLRAIMVGGEDLPAQFCELASPLVAQGQLVLRGIVSREELNELYASSQVALSPSRYESFGLVAIEAFAHGCPVISLDIAGIAEVVESGRTGILVSPDDGVEHRLAAAICTLLDDRETAVAMQRSALDTFGDRFTEDRMAEEVEAAMLEFLALNKRYAG